MAVCDRCGSIQVYRIQSGLIDKGFALVDSRAPYKCRRCGFKGRRTWSADEPDSSAELALSDGVTDPSLAVLDDLDRPRRASSATRTSARSSSRRSTSRSTGRRSSRAKKAEQPRAGEFDLSSLEVTPVAGEHESDGHIAARRWNERRRSVGASRAKRSQRRQILGAVAISALSLLVFVMLGLTRSCGGDPSL